MTRGYALGAMPLGTVGQGEHGRPISRRADAEGGAQPAVMQRHVHADGEHPRREADVVEKREVGLGRVHDVEQRGAQHDPRQQLPDTTGIARCDTNDSAGPTSAAAQIRARVPRSIGTFSVARGSPFPLDLAIDATALCVVPPGGGRPCSEGSTARPPYRAARSITSSWQPWVDHLMRLLRRTPNTDGQRHADVYVPLGSRAIPLRYPDGEPTGFELASWSLRIDGVHDGMARLDFHELIASDAGALAFHRGGRGFENPADAKYGHIAVRDLAANPGGPIAAGGRRGAPMPPLPSTPPLAIGVKSIPGAMHYKRPQDTRSGSNRGARFLHHGDPAADQGSRRDVHYTYLIWSCLNVRGGGMVRALLRDGQRVERCDVAPVTMPSYDEHGALNGSVEAVYVRVPLDRVELFGWVISAHELSGAEPVAHLVEHA